VKILVFVLRILKPFCEGFCRMCFKVTFVKGRPKFKVKRIAAVMS
jgi:hypothetical protein